MSHFSQELKKIIMERELWPAEIARETGFHQSLLSRILNGKSTISKEKLEALLSVFNDPMDSARLVAAYLQDFKFGKGSELVKISVKKSGKGNPVIEVSPIFERAWEYLRGIDGDEATENLIITLAEMRGLKSRK